MADGAAHVPSACSPPLGPHSITALLGAGMRGVGPGPPAAPSPVLTVAQRAEAPLDRFPPAEVAPLRKVRVESSPGVTILHQARPAAVHAPRRAAQCPDGTGRARVRASTPGVVLPKTRGSQAHDFRNILP